MGLLYSDNSVKTTNNIKINACSGGIYKTYKESWFERFHLQSKRSDALLDYDNHSTIVLQMVVCGDMEVMAELIKSNDLEKYLKSSNQNEKEE